MTEAPLVKVENVSFSYREGQLVLEDISFE